MRPPEYSLKFAINRGQLVVREEIPLPDGGYAFPVHSTTPIDYTEWHRLEMTVTIAGGADGGPTSSTLDLAIDGQPALAAVSVSTYQHLVPARLYVGVVESEGLAAKFTAYYDDVLVDVQ